MTAQVDRKEKQSNSEKVMQPALYINWGDQPVLFQLLSDGLKDGLEAMDSKTQEIFFFLLNKELWHSSQWADNFQFKETTMEKEAPQNV